MGQLFVGSRSYDPLEGDQMPRNERHDLVGNVYSGTSMGCWLRCQILTDCPKRSRGKGKVDGHVGGWRSRYGGGWCVGSDG